MTTMTLKEMNDMTTATKGMKISADTLTILKNFSTINPMIEVKTNQMKIGFVIFDVNFGSSDMSSRLYGGFFT